VIKNGHGSERRRTYQINSRGGCSSNDLELKRIAMIHATRASVSPVELAFHEIWPEANHRSLMDEGLAQAIDQVGELTAAISKRFVRLAEYAADTDVDAILFTFTAFGPVMEEGQRNFSIPVIKPNDPLLETALAVGMEIGLLASHPIALPMIEQQLKDLTYERGRTIDVRL